MTIASQLKIDLNAFMRDFGISKTTLGIKALKNPHTISRFISNKQDITVGTADTLYRYITKYKKDYHVS